MNFDMCAPLFRSYVTLLDQSNITLNGGKCVQLPGDQALSQIVLEAKQIGKCDVVLSQFVTVR
jgi:hypothetical protein